MYYRCTKDLYSYVIKNLKKFTADGIYLEVSKDTYINDQGERDEIFIEGWQRFFIPIDLEEIKISEVHEALAKEPFTV